VPNPPGGLHPVNRIINLADVFVFIITQHGRFHPFLQVLRQPFIIFLLEYLFKFFRRHRAFRTVARTQRLVSYHSPNSQPHIGKILSGQKHLQNCRITHQLPEQLANLPPAGQQHLFNLSGGCLRTDRIFRTAEHFSRRFKLLCMSNLRQRRPAEHDSLQRPHFGGGVRILPVVRSNRRISVKVNLCQFGIHLFIQQKVFAPLPFPSAPESALSGQPSSS